MVTMRVTSYSLLYTKRRSGRLVNYADMPVSLDLSCFEVLPVAHLFNQFTKPTLSVHQSFGTANNIVAIWQQARKIGWGVGCDIENVPDVVCS